MNNNCNDEGFRNHCEFLKKYLQSLLILFHIDYNLDIILLIIDPMNDLFV